MCNLYNCNVQLKIPEPVCRDCQAGLRSHTRGQGTGLPPPAGVRSPAAWQCSISVGVNGLCLTFSVRPCNQISSSFKIGTNYIYIYNTENRIHKTEMTVLLLVLYIHVMEL